MHVSIYIHTYMYTAWGHMHLVGNIHVYDNNNAGTCLKTRTSGSPKTASFAGVSPRSEQLKDLLGGLC